MRASGADRHLDITFGLQLVALVSIFLPARTSEQGNVIGLVSVYMSSKKIVIERTRNLISSNL